MLRTIEEQDHCRKNLESVYVAGQCEWGDALSLVALLPELKELSLISVVHIEDKAHLQTLPLPALDLDGSFSESAAPGVSSPIPTSPTAAALDEISTLRFTHANLTSLTVGGMTKSLHSLHFEIPSLSYLGLICPMKVAVLDLTSCRRLSSLAFDRPPPFTSALPSIPAPSGYAKPASGLTPLSLTAPMSTLPTLNSAAMPVQSQDRSQFYIQRLEFPSGSSSTLRDLWLHYFRFHSSLLLNLQSLSCVDIGDVAKNRMTGGELPTLSLSSAILKILRIDMGESTGFDVALTESEGAKHLVELSLTDVYLGNRSTAERKRTISSSSDAVPAAFTGTHIVQKKSVSLFALLNLEEQFPSLRKMCLRFLPVNLYLTSLSSIVHATVEDVSLENLPLETLQMPNLVSLSYAVQNLENIALVEDLNTVNKFPFLSRLSLYSMQAPDSLIFQQLTIPTLVELNLNLPVLPVMVSCVRLRTLRLGHRCFGAARFLSSNINNLLQLEELDIFCPVGDDLRVKRNEDDAMEVDAGVPALSQSSGSSADTPVLEFNHNSMRVLRFNNIVSGPIRFALPALEDLVLRHGRDIVVLELDLPKLKVVTLSDTSLKDRFSSSALKRVIILRDPKVSTRSQSKRG